MGLEPPRKMCLEIEASASDLLIAVRVSRYGPVSGAPVGA